MGDRCGFVSLPVQAPVAAGGSYLPHTASSGYGYGRQDYSLPPVDESEDKLLAKRSHQMSQVARAELTSRAGLPHCSPQRNVLTREDVRCSSGDENLPSINLSVLRESENAQNNRYGQPELPEEEGAVRESDKRSHESSDSSECEHSPLSLPTKRTWEEASASSEVSPSSGNGDGDEPTNAKRARTEEHKKSGGTGRFGSMLRSLPIINRLWPKESKRDSDSDEEQFEDAREK